MEAVYVGRRDVIRDHGCAIAGQKVVYMANNHHSAWARRCIDQADRVIFVANVDSGAAGVDVVAAATTNTARAIGLARAGRRRHSRGASPRKKRR